MSAAVAAPSRPLCHHHRPLGHGGRAPPISRSSARGGPDLHDGPAVDHL